MKIGMVIDDMGSELSRRAIQSASVSLNNADYDFVIFSQTCPICSMNMSLVPRFSLNEAWSYDGFLITTSTQSLEICKEFPAKSGLLHYVWEPDWAEKDYGDTLKLLSEVDVIVRSLSHARLIENVFGINSSGQSLLPDFEYFKNLIEDLSVDTI